MLIEGGLNWEIVKARRQDSFLTAYLLVGEIVGLNDGGILHRTSVIGIECSELPSVSSNSGYPSFQAAENGLLHGNMRSFAK